MDLRQLRRFVVLADTGSLHRTARRLGLRQPALSQSIRTLETGIGVRLVERGASGTRLTQAGEAFLSESRHILAAFDQAIQIAQRAAAGTGLPLRIGIAGDAATTRLAAVLKNFRNTYPNDHVVIVDVLTLDAGSIFEKIPLDLVLFQAPVTAQYDYIKPLWQEDVHLAIPEAHLLSSYPAVDIRDLALQLCIS